MGRKRHSAEEIVNKLRQADVDMAKGSTVTGVCNLLAISEQTYYAWRREHGGLKVDQANLMGGGSRNSNQSTRG
ncbi:MAG: transposase [Phycisphaerales bacterium]